MCNNVSLYHYALIKKPRFYNFALFIIVPMRKYLHEKEATVKHQNLFNCFFCLVCIFVFFIFDLLILRIYQKTSQP